MPSSTGYLPHASYSSSQPPRSASLPLARRMHVAQRKRLSLREYSRKSGRRAMYAKWRGRPWRKSKLSDKFSCDAGRATMSREDQRGPGVTFEHVDYNCDLCRGLCPFLSLSLSLCRLLVLSCSSDCSRARFILIPLSSLIRSFDSSVSSLLYQLKLCRRRPMIEHALGCYYGILPNFEEYIRSLRANVLREEDRTVPQVRREAVTVSSGNPYTIPVKQDNFT